MAENFVFARAFGVSTMITAARNKRNLPGICLGVTFFTTAASAAAGLSSSFFNRDSIGKGFIPLLYIMMIGAVYLITLILAAVVFGGKFGRIKKYVHISAFNGAVMGTIFLSCQSCGSPGEFILFGLYAGAGFSAASYMLSAVYQQLYSKDVPAAFRGYPAVMIFTGIVAMAVFGVLGHAPVYF